MRHKTEWARGGHGSTRGDRTRLGGRPAVGIPDATGAASVRGGARGPSARRSAGMIPGGLPQEVQSESPTSAAGRGETTASLP